jgi:transcriptional repressor NrdR
MRCPYCHSTNNKVIDSRPSREANAIRRRRECLNCHRRFTTYEQVEETMPLIVKKDGRREPYQRTKISEGIKKACEKRPVSIDVIEDFLDDLEREMLESGQREIPSNWRNPASGRSLPTGSAKRSWRGSGSGTRWPMCVSPRSIATSPTPLIS